MKIAVIGGGIVGLSSAYALASRGGDVVVCEQGSIGSGSTERSVGGIRAQFSTPVNIDLSLESIPVWESFEERFGVDIEYRRTGYLFLGRNEETVQALEETVRLQRERGVPSELLEAGEIGRYCSGVRTEQFTAGSYSPTDGFVDPHLALGGYATACADAGVEIRTNEPVIDVLESTDGDRIVGVETATDRLEADFVVNAAGPWAGRVASIAGIELPIVPTRRQVAIVAPEEPVPEGDPLTVDLESGTYFRPERDGDALVGGNCPADSDRDDPRADPDTYGKSADFEWTAAALETVSRWTTRFGPDTRVKRGWAGLYAVTPDNHAIVEETSPGFITAGGFSGHGFQHAPATGELVAELVFDGAISLVDGSALSSDRFDRDEDRTERNVV
ncbi:FAD-dependent oxidoreductase [Halostagnicola larsenii XH-48]|uniref:FAD-dependent oxidoreductase n=1 Tax=Halostagnicola larsenii XH-48 TaxID=797299 RepID=W0JQ31_9EURY|nr:FAD-dependent oxidoreductase [Halostagnicola larsenii]AHF99381.1 FAD-dependent oxidoreductase [Halostagnicola larsenii XH-48]